MSNYIIGIDPGKNGGISFISDDGLVIKHSPMLDTETSTFEVLEVMSQYNRGTTVKAYLEQVHSMPHQGVASTFTFGKHYGFIRGCLTALRIPYEEVSPQKWQAYLGILKRDIKGGETKPEHKTKLLMKAQQLFPHLKINLKTCDAVLISEYGRRIENQINLKRQERGLC